MYYISILKQSLIKLFTFLIPAHRTKEIKLIFLS